MILNIAPIFKKYLPSTTPSEDIISVAKLLFGLSSSSKLGKLQIFPKEVKYNVNNKKIIGLRVNIQTETILFYQKLLS